MTETGTYVFCVVAASKPRLTGVPRGLPRMGAVRALDIGQDLHAIVADAPLREYGEAALNRRLSNLGWVSRAAVAHEAVVEHFIGATAVLPMKLFTIFGSDARALEHVRAERARIDQVIRRVARHQEWGVRVLLDRAKASAVSRNRPAAGQHGKRGRSTAGVTYLTQKKTQRDFSLELASRARKTVAKLYDELAAKAHLDKRRPAEELPAKGGPLLLDAAFLVPRARSASFRLLTARRARAMAPYGYVVTLSGPWPPYSFVQD